MQQDLPYQHDSGYEHPHHAHHVHARAHEHFHQEYMNHTHLRGHLSVNGNMGQHEAIKQDVEQSMARQDLPRAYSELNMLRRQESGQAFHRDLAQINHDLHRRGILPNLSIIEGAGPQGFGLRPDQYLGGPPQGYGPQAEQFNGGSPEQFNGMPPGARRPQQYTYRHPNQEGAQNRYRGAQHHGWGFDPGHTGRTYDGAGKADPATLARSAQLVGQIAQEMGVDPVTAVAAMLVESGGNPQAVGDRGTSFGLFQLHRGGELGHMSPQQAFDPVTNARVALSEFRKHGYHGDPGTIAAAAQRPRDRQGYARLVDQAVPEARRLLGLG